jgi:hypothetical protein
MGQSKEQLQKKYDDCVELHRQWYIDYHTTNGKTDRRHKNLCNDEMESLRIEMRVLEKELSMVDKIIELETQLQEYLKLRSEVHTDIEKVWMYDSSFPLNEVSMEERAKLIERVFYKIANEWID